MALRISSTILDRITAEAIASPDREICGLLLGTADAVAEARSCRNVAVDPAMRFEIDPAALLAAHRAARRGGPAVIGHYHSHPSGMPEPSPRDAADAAPDGGIWLIAAGGCVTGWRAVENGALHGRFVPLRLRRAAGRATG
ncbi:Mov34/MPN/PAD-1 family protein [Sphingomonas abaci]|nr:M67 family metallopeptidase [Sphingomonas abaci]